MVILTLIANVNFGQAPNLGTASSFALFTAAGAFNEAGSASTVTGDVGTAVGAFNAFPPGILIGAKHVADPVATQAGVDVLAAYGYLAGLTCGVGHGVLLGGGEILGPNVYCMTAASTLNGTLTLNAGGDPNAIFIFKIDGALATTALSNITLTNSASSCNVYWQINGQVDLGPGSVFMGTIVANGAINLLAGANLHGRGLSREGAITMYDNTVTQAPCALAAAIPTLSEWGMIIFGVLLLGAGVFYIVRRKQIPIHI
jgi:hypothetical protein